MILSGKMILKFLSFFGLAVILLFPDLSFSQVTLKGNVIYKKDASPASNANIELLHQKEGTMTNQAGKFSVYIKNIKSNDTILISSVGYENIEVPVSAALENSNFLLVEKVGDMKAVVVFSKPEVLGSTSESVGFYRSWNYNKTGGEIGRIIKVPYKEYKIDKVRFKAANLCDTCQLRLRIRNVVAGRPGEEILKDSVTTTISKLTLDSKPAEFDLSAYDLTFNQKEVFVSLEVLNCNNLKKDFCAFNFAGTEMGEYIYKTKESSDWETVNDYTIYLKLFLRY